LKPAPRLWLALIAPIALGPPPPAPAVPTGDDRDLEKRVGAIYRRMNALEPGTPQARAAGRDLEEVGHAYLERGKPSRAIELLEQSCGLDPDNGLALVELTLAYVRAENYPFARFYLELAEERAPRAPPEAYALLGEVYYSLNRLEDAVLAWEQFERLGGTHPGILRRMRSAREELSLTSRQSYRQIGDFLFYFDAAIPPEITEGIAGRLTKTSRELATFFQTQLPGPQVVILYTGRAYFALVSIPDWVSGVFDGKIRLAVDPGGGVTPELEMVLVHELGHAYVRHASHDRAPGWLHEGLAQWFESKRLLRLELKDAFVHQPVHSLSEMEGNLARKADRVAARSDYVEALGLVEYLMQERGSAAVACLVRELGQGATLEEALRRETGLTSAELLSGFRAWAGL
jgi:tetratricopeptide (TPR) repeat protein